MHNRIQETFDNSQKKTVEKLHTFSTVLNEGYRPNDSKLYIKESFNCYLRDYDNNIYIDTAMGGGSLILGHSHNLVNKAIKQQLKDGTLYTIPSFKAHELAELLKIAIPNFDHFVFCSTGSEATMRAIRIARAFTNRKKIAIFSGGWHGSHDLLLVDDKYEENESTPKKILKSNGTLPETLDNVLLLPYNHENAFNLIEEHKKDLAMVFIEPAQGSNPRDDMHLFLSKLRKITTEYNILLGFDEIITGFRVALGGGQEFYNIKADIATYGKALGGGLPIAAIGGTKEVMKTITDGSYENNKPIFMGGTFSANPLSISSSIAVIEYLIKKQNEIYPKLELSSQYLKNTLNNFCKEQKVSAQIMGINSMLRFIFTDYPIRSRFERDKYEINIDKQTLFYLNMLNNGIHIASNRLNFLSLKHTKDDIEKIIKVYKKSIIDFKNLGYL